MSKKKKKFKKSLNQKLEERLNQEKPTEGTRALEVKNLKIAPSPATKEILNNSDRYQTTRHDVKKSLIWIAILLVILIIFTIIHSTTDYLQSFGDWLYRMLNLKV